VNNKQIMEEKREMKKEEKNYTLQIQFIISEGRKDEDDSLFMKQVQQKILC